jgi:flagellar motor protein MotB
LSANGYGDNHPISLGDTPEDLKNNRRIELKITQR